ncbi:MAG: hypothetical protein QOJ55_1318 [Solirubrobacteraceae bacterium]|jgi:hypothetical protein|nr:hypothetical protein [Solirubrobacteraceae bacterium]MDX6673210.1 hypothetical protein [Solirubrobacteraceae bacterium]
MASKLARSVRVAGLGFGLAVAVASQASASVPLAAQSKTVDQGKPVFATALDRTITRFDVQWDADCSNGATWSDRTLIPRVASDAAGDPVDTGSYAERPGSGGSADVAWTLQGTSNVQEVAGTFSATIALRDGSGAVVATCTTGTIGFDLQFRARCGEAPEGPAAHALITATKMHCTVVRRIQSGWSRALTARRLRRFIPTRPSRLGAPFRLAGFVCRGKAGIVAGEHTVRCTASGRRSFEWVSFHPSIPEE